MKKILIFLGGMVSGFVLGIFVSNRSSDRNKVLEVVEFNPEERKKSDISTEKKSPAKFEKPELDQLVKKYRAEESEYTDYSGTPDPDAEDDLYPTDDEPEDNDELNDPKFSEPQVISRYEFENEKKHYEEETLIYYLGDDTLCDERDQVITSPEDLIGDALLFFGIGSDSADTVYVCNDKRGTKYEVIRVEQTFQEHIGLK